MKRALIRLAVFWWLATAALGAFADEVLYFMVDDPMIQDNLVKYRASDADEYGRTITDARVAAFKTADADKYISLETHDSAVAVYLDLYYQDGTPPRWVVDYTANPRVDSAWIVNGVMTDGTTGAAYSIASLGGPELAGEDLTGYSFAIELGTWSGDDTWVLAAMSDMESYESLKGAKHIGSELDIQSQREWNPGYYSAPEPSGGLLLALGIGILALRRRRFTA